MDNNLLASWSQRHTVLDDPHFSSPRDLSAESSTTFLKLGTGYDIINHVSQYIIDNVQQELILVTCFWAKSDSSNAVADILRALSARQVANGPTRTPIRVRICFSSSSIWQKLFHTQSMAGKIYDSSQWRRILNLPSPQELRGLDVQVKSIFMLPFSVMHPKFFILDRKIVLLPSCNISWEPWFEGVLDLHGETVQKFVQFWESFWCHWSDNESWNIRFTTAVESAVVRSTYPARGSVDFAQTLQGKINQLLFLPSHFHRHPRFRPFPWQHDSESPVTPLNVFMLHLLENARKTIFLQTPNVTSPPLLKALVGALENGVDVTIITNERLMFLEQLVTAGTTTPRCLNALTTAHETTLQRQEQTKYVDSGESGTTRTIGRLRILYFGPSSAAAGGASHGKLPVSTHLKLTIVDDEVSVFGSGNMDRASWYTSQELGVAIQSPELARSVKAEVMKMNKQHTGVVYDA